MKIVVSFKVVPDDQDIQVSGDGSLDYAKAHQIVSTYDLNAMEAAAQLAAANEGSEVVGITVGGKKIDDSKTKKNVLARGIDQLYMTADDACADLDAGATAAALAELVAKVGEYDLIICGDGSADNYAQQVDVQLAAKLGLPVVNGATKIEAGDGVVTVVRTLEDVVETVEVPLPAVVSVAPDVALPRIPGMKDILAAGKKPMNVFAAEGTFANSIEVVDCKAPKQADRKLEIIDAADDGAIEKFAAAIKGRSVVRGIRKGSKTMKAFVLAEHSDAAQELCAGARTMADEVVLVAIADMEVPAAVADKVLHVALPEGAVVDDAADTVIAAFDAEQPGVVLVEPTRHMKVVAGKVAAHAGASIIPDVIEFDGDVATDMYFGGVGMKKQKATGVAFYGVGAGVFAEAAASGANATEELAWVAPAKAIKLVSSVPVEKSGVDLNKADVVVAARSWLRR